MGMFSNDPEFKPTTDKKKKRGLASMEEKMGFGEGSEFVALPNNGLIPPEVPNSNGVDSQRSVGSKVRDRMTGRA